MMNAKDYLLQYKLMQAKIQNAEDDLKALREERAAISINLDGMPHGSHISDRTAELASRLVDAECEVMAMRSAAWSVRIQIINTIGRLSDPIHVRLLHLRYIEGHTWEQISEEMHYSYQWVAGPLHGHALQEIDKLINCR